MKRRTCFGSLSVLLLLGGCSASPLIENDMVDRWCGDHPCGWDVQGDIERVGSWHPDDYAVELLSDDAEISQVNSNVSNHNVTCFGFTLIAKVSHGARATLELDFMADGSSEFVQQLPASDWDRLTFKITAPDWYKGVRFIIRKGGPGEVILAELAAGSANGSCTSPRVELDDRPAGARCTSDEECADGRCEDNVCSLCAVGRDDCDSGSVCGRVITLEGVEHVCVPEASGDFGSLCEDDRQCQSGHCQNHACSECDGASCSDGRACALAHPVYTTSDYWPSLCDPASGRRATGELCTDDVDCASLMCDGAKAVCTLPCSDHTTYSVCPTCVIEQIQPGRCK